MLSDQIIKSIGYDQTVIISDILTLYCPTGIDCDPTYSKGNFYGSDNQPKYKFDLYPQVPGVVQANANSLPLPDSSVRSVMFDPPFLPRTRKGFDPDKMKVRFGSYKSDDTLYQFYREALEEFFRILVPKGILIFKCQDFIDHSTQHFSHVMIANWAESTGFCLLDLFILASKHRIIRWPASRQKHARKYHSYFWVFKKV